MSDIAISAVGVTPVGLTITKKPSYLIVLEDTTTKNKSIKRIITIDKPEFLNGFIQVKGVFTDSPEEEIIKDFSNILTSIPKDLILELIVPWHKISYIRSLVFKQK